MKKQWKGPAVSVAAFAAIACAIFALLFLGTGHPGGDTATPAPSEDPVYTANDVPRKTLQTIATPTLPPAEPLPKITMRQMGRLPDATTGWQAAAVAGGIVWYYNPATSELAWAEKGKAVSMALPLSQGQIVDTYTFLPARGGYWLAFTVHQAQGDSVWLVTREGRKMAIPEDVQWADDSGSPAQVDLSGVSLAPMVACTFYGDGPDTIPDNVQALATFADGETYLLSIDLDKAAVGGELVLDDRKGYCMYIARDSADETLVSDGRSVSRILRKDGGGYAFGFGGDQAPVDLKGNRFALFRLSPSDNWAVLDTHILLIYEGDTSNTLWETDSLSGKAEKVAAGCVAAGWIDSGTYWYATEKDGAAVMRRQVQDQKAVIKRVTLSFGINTNYVWSSATVSAVFHLQNMTGKDFIVPACIPCSLSLKKDGKVFWSKDDEFRLSDYPNRINLYRPAGDSSVDTAAGNGPITVPPGYVLDIWLPEIPCEETGDYTLEGRFFGENVYCKAAFNSDLPRPLGVAIQGNVLKDGRLSVTISNRSRAAFTVLQPDNNGTDLTLPPTVCYRLLSGGAVVKNGKIQMAKNRLTASEACVQPGESLTLTETSAIPNLSHLDPGEYRLECYLEMDKDMENMPWGFAYGYYFDVPFSVP